MINIKPDIYKKLINIMDNVSYGYPKDFTVMPLITYSESTNVTRIKDRDCGYEMAYIGFTFEVWNKDESEDGIQPYIEDIDDVMTEYGFTRTYCSDVIELMGYLHKEMTYEARVDSNGVIYSIN